MISRGSHSAFCASIHIYLFFKGKLTIFHIKAEDKNSIGATNIFRMASEEFLLKKANEDGE